MKNSKLFLCRTHLGDKRRDSFRNAGRFAAQVVEHYPGPGSVLFHFEPGDSGNIHYLSGYFVALFFPREDEHFPVLDNSFALSGCQCQLVKRQLRIKSWRFQPRQISSQAFAYTAPKTGSNMSAPFPRLRAEKPPFRSEQHQSEVQRTRTGIRMG